MNAHAETLLVLVAAAGITAQWLAWRTRLPAIVLLLAAGMVLGPVLGWLRPSADLGPLLEPVIKLGVAVILFDGGLNLRLHELKSAAAGVRRLVFPGAPIAWLLGSGAAHLLGGLSWPVALIFGAITVVTGPTVILPLLRQARLTRRPASFLKWEGILNDPLGALLAVLIYQYYVSAGSGPDLAGQLADMALAVAGAGALGAGAGWLLADLFRRGQVPEYLKPPVILAAVLAAYAVANLLQAEAGLVATTVMGMVLGNRRLPSIDELRRFKEYISILLVSAVFLLLTADVDLSLLAGLDARHALLLAAIVFLARPLTVWLATLGGAMHWRERLLVGWIAPRGVVAAAVAGVFAPELAAIGYEDAGLLVPLVFALIIATVVLHGLSIAPLARVLGLAAGRRQGLLIVGASPWTVALAQALRALEVEVLLADADWYRLRPARLAGIPVYFGEILSESAEENLELHAMGYLLAATDNDAYNALVCTRFAPELQRARVFQLPLGEGGGEDPRALVRSLRGNIALDGETGYDELLRRHFQGWTFQKTQLTESYGYADLARDLDPAALPVLRVRGEHKELLFKTAAGPWEPQPGDTVVVYVPPRRTAGAAAG